jgi:hypothetical protein
MSIGLTAWIAVPSIGNSLQSGFLGYANAVGTYIVVQNNGNPASINQTIPSNLIQSMAQIPGIESIYPIVTNYTIFLFPDPKSVGTTQIGNKTVNLTLGSEGFLSAVIGGNTGYPQQLMDISAGRIPGNNEAAFDLNSYQDNPFNLSNVADVQVANRNFTATEVGINKYIPLIGNNLGVLWNASFMEQELGSSLFNTTFGHGINFVILKATSVANVGTAVSAIKNLLSAYPSYLVIYDQSSVDNLLSLQKGVAPFYTLLGIVSLSFAAIAVLIVSVIAINRRGWESGLLISQGWTWKDLRDYFFFYFLILFLVSLSLSILASLVVAKYSATSFEVYGGYITINVSLGLPYLEVAGLMAIVLTAAASVFMTWRLQRMGLDRILREY